MGNNNASPPAGKPSDSGADDPRDAPFPLEITDILDLHSFAPHQIGELVTTYLAEAHAKGLSTLRIIHGKGSGAQRVRVQSILRRTPFVASFQDAPAEAGGWGATLVWLRTEPRSVR